MRFALENPSKIFLSIIAATLATSCGMVLRDDTKDYNSRSASADAEEASATDLSSPGGIIPYDGCEEVTKDLAFADMVLNSLHLRSPNAEEKTKYSKGDMDRGAFLDEVLASAQMVGGIKRFATMVFRLESGIIDPPIPDDSDDFPAYVKTVRENAGFRQEIPELYWDMFLSGEAYSNIMHTQDVFVNKDTAEAYGIAPPTSTSFVRATKPEFRAGIFGMKSFLHSISSSSLVANNNYGRWAFLVYYALGYKIQNATDGPTGSGDLIPAPDCSPERDFRVMQGMPVGHGRVAKEGPTCGGCHYGEGLSLGSRVFGFADLQGFDLVDSLDDLSNGDITDAGYADREELEYFVNEYPFTETCWSYNKKIAASQFKFRGLKQLGENFAKVDEKDGVLSRGLAMQMANNFINEESAHPNIASTVRDYYIKNDRTLKAALKGFFLSDYVQCAKHKTPE